MTHVIRSGLIAALTTAGLCVSADEAETPGPPAWRQGPALLTEGASGSDEKPLSELEPGLFVNLIEGCDRLGAGSMKMPYFCYTGVSTDSVGTRAVLAVPQFAEWTSEAAPEPLSGERVTFVIPWGPGGEGAKIQGVPFLVSVNDRPAVVVHSSVTGTTLWRRGDVQALFVLVRRDRWGDPFGLLLLSVPASFVEPGRPATLRVEGRPAPNLEGSFILVGYTLGNVQYVREAGGVQKLAALKEQADAAGGAPAQRRRFDPLVELPGMRDDSLCLTGNAPPEEAAKNQRVEGRYTYYDGRTDSFYFPHFSPYYAHGRASNFDEFPHRAGGWVRFDEGKLTDGQEQTKIAWPMYLQTAVGMDIVFDLGAAHQIDQVDATATDAHVRNLEVLLKADGDPRWTTVQTITDRAAFTRGHYPKLPNVQALPIGGMTARYVRLNACWEATQCGFREVRIWGRPLSGPETPRVALRQQGGEMTVPRPAEIPIALPDHPLLPLPREMTSGEGSFTLSEGTNLVVVEGADNRTIHTARILYQDLLDELGIQTNFQVVAPAQLPVRGIVIHPSGGRGSHAGLLEGVGPQGYVLTVTPERVEIVGRDEQGTFYATQTLLLLLRPRSAREFELPVCVIRDWPDKAIRMFATGSVAPTPGFIKALARFKVTHFQLYYSGRFDEARGNNQAARDRFVKYVPIVGFNTAWAPDPRQFTERHPGEKYEDLNPGRINPCPSNPEMWKHYFSEIDRVADLYGDYINICMDEMYMPEAGSRWNVCDRCRARNLTGHELLADTIEKIDAHIRSVGKRTMVIDSPFFAAGISHNDDQANDWRKAADILAAKGLANGMIVYIWHGLPLAQRLKALGYDVLAWGGVPRERLDEVYSGNFLNIGDAAFRPAEILAMMPTLWSPQRAVAGSETADALIERFMPVFNQLASGAVTPSRLPGAEFFPLDLSGVANRTFHDAVAGDGQGWADLGPNYDLRALTPGRRELAGVPFDILDDHAGQTPSCVMVHNRFYYNRELPDRVEIPVHRQANSLVFLHTLDGEIGQAYWCVREQAGYYFIVYENGRYETLELRNAINICKFDGLTSWWDSAPRGKAMARATLAWRGQMGAGVEANLYVTEWVNPHPHLKIDRVIFASPKRATSANPILLAATAVATPSYDERTLPQSAYPFGSRRAELLYPAQPLGRKIDLTRGRLDFDANTWTTDDGIVLSLSELPRFTKSLEITQHYWNTIQGLLYDDEHAAPVGSYSPEIWTRAVLPTPRRLTGILLSGAYRGSVGQAVDRPPAIHQYQVFVTADGKTFRSAGRDHHIPEEEGPLWLPLDGRPVTEVRVYQRRDPSGQNHTTSANDFGLGLLELYEAQP